MSRSAKVIISILTILILTGEYVFSQLEAGIKIGTSTIQYANPDFETIILDSENLNEYALSVDDIRFGYHVGLYSRLKVWKIILQPEVVLNSNTISYKVEDLTFSNADKFYKEQYTSLDIPVVLGLKFNWFNIQGGVSGHIPIYNVSELTNIDGYAINPKNFTYSYLAGLGFDFWRFRLDFRYELSTDFFGEHIRYNGQSFHFPNKNNRIIAGLAYKF